MTADLQTDATAKLVTDRWTPVLLWVLAGASVLAHIAAVVLQLPQGWPARCLPHR
jgi:hypothetical protein